MHAIKNEYVEKYERQIVEASDLEFLEKKAWTGIKGRVPRRLFLFIEWQPQPPFSSWRAFRNRQLGMATTPGFPLAIRHSLHRFNTIIGHQTLFFKFLQDQLLTFARNRDQITINMSDLSGPKLICGEQASSYRSDSEPASVALVGYVRMNG